VILVIKPTLPQAGCFGRRPPLTHMPQGSGQNRREHTCQTVRSGFDWALFFVGRLTASIDGKVDHLHASIELRLRTEVLDSPGQPLEFKGLLCPGAVVGLCGPAGAWLLERLLKDPSAWRPTPNSNFASHTKHHGHCHRIWKSSHAKFFYGSSYPGACGASGSSLLLG